MKHSSFSLVTNVTFEYKRYNLGVYTKIVMYNWNNSVCYMSTFIVFSNENRALQEITLPLFIYTVQWLLALATFCLIACIL